MVVYGFSERVTETSYSVLCGTRELKYPPENAISFHLVSLLKTRWTKSRSLPWVTLLSPVIPFTQ